MSDLMRWTRRLQALAQTGLTYAKDPFDRERYGELQRIAAEMMAAQMEEGDAERLAAGMAREVGYATPKVDVRAAVFREGRILLVLEREDGRWTLPGGWADVGDAPSEAAERETREESGYEVKARKIAMVYDRDRQGHPPIPYHAYKLFFLCELVGGEAAESEETAGVGWFEEGAIPPLSETRVTRRQIAELFTYQKDRGQATAFD